MLRVNLLVVVICFQISIFEPLETTDIGGEKRTGWL